MSVELPTARANPMVWVGEEEAQGVFVGVKDEDADLLGLGDQAHQQADFHLPADFSPSTAVVELFSSIRGKLTAAANGETPKVIDLLSFSDEDRRAISGMLGEGEVSIMAGADPVFQIEESVLPGVWRVRAAEESGEMVADYVEIADVPTAVRAAAAALAKPMAEVSAEQSNAQGVMNGAAVLAEVRARAADWRAGVKNHVVNFTLLPMTDEDGDLISNTLGDIPLTLVSTGFGTCKITGTRASNVWRVQFLNAMSAVILDTLEIGDVPEFARAALEDFEDSGARLDEIMGTYLS